MGFHRCSVFAALLFACAGSAHAQCTGRWLTGPTVPAQFLDEVLTLAQLPGGDVLVGGRFNTIGDITAHSLAIYHPSSQTWSPFGAGAGGPVWAIAVLPSGDLLIGGEFSSAGGAPANNIVRYSPPTGTWSALGSGTNGGVYALLPLPAGDVLVAGYFQIAGPWSVGCAARVNPTTGAWSRSGTGEPGSAFASLTQLSDGNVIGAGTVLLRYDAVARRWTPASWSGSGTPQFTSVLALPGGDFLTSNATVALNGSHLMRYTASSTTWSGITDAGGLPNGAVNSMARTGSDVVLAGAFLTAGNATSRGIARYNIATGAWGSFATGVDLGLNDHVNAVLILPGGDIIIGGRFPSVAGTPSVNFARWTTRPACPADFNCSATLEAQDIFDFLAAWFAADPNADFNAANGLEVQDIFDFLIAWFTGC